MKNSTFNIKQFKKDFNDSKIAETLFSVFKDDIICIYVTGSSGCEIRSSHSDIDLVILTKHRHDFVEIPYLFKYEGLTVHGYINPLCLDFYFIANYFFGGQVLTFLVNDDLIIGKNDNNKKYLDFFLENKNLITEIFIHYTLEFFRDLLLTMISSKEYFYEKPWYQLVYCYKIYKNESTDIVERLKIYKETEEDRQEVIRILTELGDWHINDQTYFIRTMDYCDKALKLIDDKK